MRNLKISIKFKTLPRFGKAGLDDQDTRDHLGADQFFSALSLAWIELFGLNDYKESVLETFIKANATKDLPWLHSSFFPEIKDELYLPAPLLKLSDTNNNLEKKERLPWINFKAINKLRRGEGLAKEDYANAIQEYSYQAVNLSNPNDSKPYITTVLGPKPTRKDASKDSSECLVLSGFLDLYHEALFDKIRACCNFLQEEGLGANRSSGYGQIKEIEISDHANFSDAIDSNCWIILSDYVPRVNETLNEIDKIKNSEKSAYKLISKAGWIYSSANSASDKRKQKTYMMSVGSSFDFKPLGSLVNVGTEEHPSYRYGLAYTLGVNTN